MGIADHLSVIWQRRWQVLGASLAVAMAVYVWRSQGADVYEARSELTVTVAQTPTGDGSPTLESTDLVTAGFATAATSTPVLGAAREVSGLALTLDEVDDRVSVSSATGSGFLTVTTRGPSSGEALALNEAVVEALITHVESEQERARAELLAPIDQEIADLREELADLDRSDPSREGFLGQLTALLQVRSERQIQPEHRIDVLNPSSAEPDPVAPRPRRDALLELVVALVVNAELAVVAAAVGDRVASEQQLVGVLAARRLPVLARVPNRGGGVNLLESFRELRTNLLLLDLGHAGVSLAMLGAEPGMGKTFVSLNLARGFANGGQPAVLVDGDLRSPAIHGLLGLRRSPGLSEVAWFAGPLDLQAVAGQPSLRVLTAGEPAQDPSAVASGLGIPWAVAQLSEDAVVVVDTPPVNLFSDAAAIAHTCSAYLLVVDVQRTRRSQLERALDRLDHAGGIPAGVVLNRARIDDRRSTYAQERPVRRGWGRTGTATPPVPAPQFDPDAATPVRHPG
ncbi:MAG: hypothetical protein H0V33_10170 [Acidimicrobiia bacterium]|nr:hypothetical protein [Acidimicrobiia bacterium]